MLGFRRFLEEYLMPVNRKRMLTARRHRAQLAKKIVRKHTEKKQELLPDFEDRVRDGSENEASGAVKR